MRLPTAPIRRVFFVALCAAAVTAGCVQDADTILEPDPGDAAADRGPDAAVEAPAPAVRIEPAAVALDGVGDVAMLAIHSVGQAPLTIERIGRRGEPDFSVVHAGGNALLQGPAELSGPDGLAPGESIVLTIEALAGPPAAATLLIETDDPDQPLIEVPVGFPDAPCLRALPMAVDFGDSLLGSTHSQPVDIVNCGAAPVDVFRIALSDATDPQFTLGQPLPDLGPLQPGAALTVVVIYDASVEAPVNGTLIVEVDGLALGVPLLARGLGAQCPVAMVAEEAGRAQAGDVVVLDGSLSVDRDARDGQPSSWAWTVVGRPDGSTAQPSERLHDPAQPGNGGVEDDPSTPTAMMFLDRPGLYVFELQVTDLAGCTDQTRMVIEACPCEDDGIRIELNWDGRPDDAAQGEGIDLDLHLLHPLAENWFSRPWDCHFAEPTPDWGEIGNDVDDPRLDVDAVGDGPEVITLRRPEDTDVLRSAYLVGVDHGGVVVGPNMLELPDQIDAELRILVGGQVAYARTQALGDGQFWDAAEIHWPSGEVVPRDRIYRTPP